MLNNLGLRQGFGWFFIIVDIHKSILVAAFSQPLWFTDIKTHCLRDPNSKSGPEYFPSMQCETNVT